MSNKEKILAILRDSYGNLAWGDIADAIDAIYNPPPAPTRDHNSLAVTENTPRGTLVVVWDTPTEFKYYRHFSHIDNEKFYCFHDGCKDGPVSQWKHAERYIGQHFIPWDASQSDGSSPCIGRVAIQYGNGSVSTHKEPERLAWNINYTGYLPITDTGKIDWERVPR